MSAFALALLLTSAAAGAPADTSGAERAELRGPLKMKASQIREYNKDLSKDHPAYIRCVSEAVTGSIAMRNKVCRTNKEWARVQELGNSEARTMVDNMNRGSTNGEPPPGDVRPGT